MVINMRYLELATGMQEYLSIKSVQETIMLVLQAFICDPDDVTTAQIHANEATLRGMHRMVAQSMRFNSANAQIQTTGLHILQNLTHCTQCSAGAAQYVVATMVPLLLNKTDDFAMQLGCPKIINDVTFAQNTWCVSGPQNMLILVLHSLQTAPHHLEFARISTELMERFSQNIKYETKPWAMNAFELHTLEDLLLHIMKTHYMDAKIQEQSMKA